MSIFVIISCFLLIRYTFCEDERDLETLQKLFLKKYSSSGYYNWKELQDANTTAVSHVCSKYAFVISSATEMKVEGTKSFRVPYTLFNYTEPALEIDTLTCNISLIGRTGEEKGKQKFYLTDGDEPNSAFKFALLEGAIFLTRKVTEGKIFKLSNPRLASFRTMRTMRPWFIMSNSQLENGPIAILVG